MNEQLLISKVQQLNSEKLKQELLFFLDYLLSQQYIGEKPLTEKTLKRVPQFGCAKGTFKMAADFDEPLEDFQDYMP